jgi:hypothetical protein
MIAPSGYYQLVSTMPDVDPTPPAGSAKPELKPLSKSLRLAFERHRG